MRRLTKIVATIAAAVTIGSVTLMGLPVLGLDGAGSVVKAEDKYLKYSEADKLEDGGQYIMLFNTTVGTESDVTKFYTNNGELAALQADSSGVKVYKVPDNAYEGDRKAVLLSEDLKDSIVWKCEVSGGNYLLSNNGKYIQDNGSKIVLSDDKTASGCTWTYTKATGEEKYDYTPLKSVSGSNVIRYSASASAFALGNPASKDTDSRNSNIYLYKVTNESVSEENLPTPTPLPRKPADPRTKKVQILACSDYQRYVGAYSDGEKQYGKDDVEVLYDQVVELTDVAYFSGLDSPDYLLFGGDTTCVKDSVEDADAGQDKFMDIITNCWPNLNYDNSFLLQGNHDPEGTKNLRPSGEYEFDDFIIYLLNEDDFPTEQEKGETYDHVFESAIKLDDYLDECKERKETRPIFIASHTGLHYDIDRTDGNNQFAWQMFDVINEKAEDLDIVFLFGHNHTNGDEQVGGSLTFFEKGDELAVCHEDSIANKSGVKTPLNFTYMNYGYIGNVGDVTNNESEVEVTDILTVTGITIYDDTIEVSRYSKNGWESKYDRTIVRDHAPEPTQAPTAEPTKVPDNKPADQVGTPNAGATPSQPPVQQTAPTGTIGAGTSDGSNAAAADKAVTAKEKIKLSSVKVKYDKAKKRLNIKGKVSIKGATVKIKVGSSKYKKAKVKGKTFTFAVALKNAKNVKATIKATKKGCKAYSHSYPVK